MNFLTCLINKINPPLLSRALFQTPPYHLFRRRLNDEVEFVTIMWFDSIEAVQAFAGDDYETAVVPPKARALLSRYDTHAQHYEVQVYMKSG